MIFGTMNPSAQNLNAEISFKMATISSHSKWHFGIEILSVIKWQLSSTMALRFMIWYLQNKPYILWYSSTEIEFNSCTKIVAHILWREGWAKIQRKILFLNFFNGIFLWENTLKTQVHLKLGPNIWFYQLRHQKHSFSCHFVKI